MNNERLVLLQAVKEAGKAIVNLQQTGFSISYKENRDLLTQADLLANDILKSHLVASFPDDGWLSEESVDDLNRLNRRRVWIVDPIDGTKEYAQGIPEYAISVALVENAEPILACVYNPVTDELYHAVKGQGAWQGEQRIFCNETISSGLSLLASRSEYQRGEWDIFQKQHQVKVVGSIAYKLALIAAGKAHATFSLGPKSEWDIAAGVLLVTEAGGRVSDKDKQPFKFNQTDVLVNGIVASATGVNELVFRMISESV